ncbi:MAG: single-stranded-DNA-specific exonuclease, partial [Halothiobacillaceae bacterium]
LVAQGLARIRAGRACAGINALLHIGGREAARIAATDLGFVVGPRLNAAGRLDDMSLGIECLLSDDAATALNIATALDQLNRERRTIEAQMKAQALTHLEEAAATAVATAPLGLCLYHAAWHQGVIGIVAARIKERYHRPVIAFALAKPGELKGSARSIPGLHIRDILDAVAARHPGLLSKFGGHAMAAGLTLALEDLEPFRHAFDAEVRAQATAELLDEVVYSDGELAAPQICLTLAETLKQGGPWGQGFPEPTASFDAIAFNADDRHWPHLVAQVHVVYKLDINEYRGVRSAQLLVEYVAPVT